MPSHSISTDGANGQRIVANLVGDSAYGQLAASQFVDRPFLYGGERNMYELAFAAAASGFEVELRGWLHRDTFERMAEGTGARPNVGMSPRRPEADDLVVIPEGWQNPLDYARLLLSPARLAMFVLAPPGLFGWPFSGPGWTRPDPLTVPLDSVARPESFQAIHRLGISLLTPSHGLATAAETAGVPCTFVGCGRPEPAPEPPRATRDADAAGLLRNRWAPLVREVVRDLTPGSVDLIDEAPNDEVRSRLARARVLLWPSRIEGHTTIPWEARSVGCVPVALSTNRFGNGLNEESGVVLVDSVDQIAPAVRDLLADDGRWRELSERAMRTALQDVRWDRYVDRVASFFSLPASAGPERSALAGMGEALDSWLEGHDRMELQRTRDRNAELEVEAGRLRDRNLELYVKAEAVRDRKDELEAERAQLLARRAVRWTLALEHRLARRR